MPSIHLDEVIRFCTTDERVCPVGQKWKQFTAHLKQRAAGKEPPAALVGRDWWKTSNEMKRQRFHQQLLWAEKMQLLDDAFQYLSALPATAWHSQFKPSLTNAAASPAKPKKRLPRKSGFFNKLEFVRDEISEIQGIDQKPAGGIKAFCSRIAYVLSLGFREKEIFVFGLLQWVSIGLAYLLWVQMLGWIPEEVWRSTEDSDAGSIADWVLLAWSFVCVGLAAFPVGIFTGCMGAAHFLHKQGRPSTVASCLKLVLPQSWPLWSFHWIDGWITVNQILERLPSDDKQSAASKAASEAMYYAWKIGVAGVLPGIVTGKGLFAAGISSVNFVKSRFIDVARLRAGYSALCWVIGVAAYVGMILLLFTGAVMPDDAEIYGYIYHFYLWAALPILAALSLIMLLLRPIYVLALCDLYSDYLEEKGLDPELPENPPLYLSALVAFLVLCLCVAMVYVFRDELGIVAMLSTPYGESYSP